MNSNHTLFPKAIIFDMGGALYDQWKLRQRMLIEISKRLILRPACLKDMKVLWKFRRAKEKNVLANLRNIENQQYIYVAEACGVCSKKVRDLVYEWMFGLPLNYFHLCRFPGVLGFFANLKRVGILTGIFSDYPAQEKLKVLGLSPDVVFCATDKDVE